jgi:hypothetical protein
MRIVERYPLRLVNAVLKALRQEMLATYELNAMEAGQHVDEPDIWQTNSEYYQEVYDAITGVRLDRNWWRKPGATS